MPTVRVWSRRILESEIARPLILIVAVFVLWDVTIRIFRIPPYLIPAPWDVAKMLVAEWPRLWRESLFTAYATLGGFGLSILLGIPIAMVIAYSRVVERKRKRRAAAEKTASAAIRASTSNVVKVSLPVRCTIARTKLLKK